MTDARREAVSADVAIARGLLRQMDEEGDGWFGRAASTIRALADRLAASEAELTRWKQSFSGHVYVPNHEWSDKCAKVRDLTQRLAAVETERENWQTDCKSFQTKLESTLAERDDRLDMAEARLRDAQTKLAQVDTALSACNAALAQAQRLLAQLEAVTK